LPAGSKRETLSRVLIILISYKLREIERLW
jgi:hypothetical protein